MIPRKKLTPCIAIPAGATVLRFEDGLFIVESHDGSIWGIAPIVEKHYSKRINLKQIIESAGGFVQEDD